MANEWRLLYLENSDVADLAAVPAAVAEGRIAGRFILAAKTTPETLVVQRVTRKGVLVGAEVSVDFEEAGKRSIDVAVMPRSGRASPKPAGTLSLKEMMLGAEDECVSVERSDDDLAALLYTSGTTGKPKGVMLTHGNFVSECRITHSVIETVDGEDRFVSLVPFFHIFGLAAGCAIGHERGCAVVLIPQYSPRVFIDALERSHPTVVLAIPTQYSHLVRAARRRPVKLRKPLKYCISGAAPLQPEVLEEFRERFGAPIIEGYGMTETTAAVSLNPADNVRPGSIGKPIPGVEAKIVDAEGRDVAAGESGELLIRGPTVCRGYYGLPEASAEAFTDDGYLRTGDVAHFDEDGYLYITDRLKDIIIKGGYNISPREVEDALMAHEDVAEAGVVGEIGGGTKEAIHAFCVLRTGASVSQNDLLDYCRKHLAAYKAPDTVAFVSQLPRSATGKLLRRELRESQNAAKEGA